MTAAAYQHGDYLAIDYTPATGDVAAGDIVLVGNTTGLTCGVAHKPISNGVLGALSAGGGVYDCQVASTYAAGTKVYKALGTNILTSTSTNAALFGFTVETSGAVNATVKVLHKPYV